MATLNQTDIINDLDGMDLGELDVLLLVPTSMDGIVAILRPSGIGKTKIRGSGPGAAAIARTGAGKCKVRDVGPGGAVFYPSGIGKVKFLET